MGTCVSSHRKSSTMNVHVSSGSNRKPDHHVVIPPSPIKEKFPMINGNVAVKPQWPPLHTTANSRDFGSKEETFFDSQAWLDSDCESDFMSVNGEFTPSRGNTPVHHNFSTGTPLVKGSVLAIDGHEPSMTLSQPSASPVKKNKRLSELFSESQRENHNDDDDDEKGEGADGNGVVGSLGAAVGHGVRSKSKRERWVEIVHVQSCLPRVLSSCRPVAPQQTQVRGK